MKINFYEEYPTDKNLEKLKLVKKECKVYIAAKSFSEFLELEKKVKKINKKAISCYWPVLEKDEGYWMSPFSKRKALKRIIKEIGNSKKEILWDAELPVLKPVRFIKGAANFALNLFMIKRFIKTHKVVVAEYPFTFGWRHMLMRRLGVSYHGKHRVTKMYYHSMHEYKVDKLERTFRRLKKKYGNRFIPSFGVIATGVLGNERILSPELLEIDLEIAKKTGIREVIIFRLGGLKKKYVDVLSRYY